ncbi:MAG: hypothetical protein IJS09_10110 [Treponema sp.]|nr:hypothetical protein [Treponema sp.]
MFVSKLFRSTLVLAISFAAVLFASCTTEGDTHYVYVDSSAQEKTFPVTVTTFKSINAFNVFYEGEKPEESFSLGFLEGKEDIPYFILSDETLEKSLVEPETQNWRSYRVSDVTASSTSVVIRNEKTNSSVKFDLTGRKCIFDNYDAFFQMSEVYSNSAEPMMDYIKFAVYGSNGTSVPSYSNIPGQPIALDWSTQDIGVIIANVDGKYYLAMPLQSYTDIFGADFVWNGRHIFYASGLLLWK